ncbi:MAG: hypothetical protein KF859_11335 [Phycisphaeraceae bacterium]|nr:hypothetical protein [Phycisphaeraceae bacterium]
MDATEGARGAMTTGYEEYDERVKAGTEPDPSWDDADMSRWGRFRRRLSMYGRWFVRGLTRMVISPQGCGLIGGALALMLYAAYEPYMAANWRLGLGYGEWVRRAPRAPAPLPQGTFVVVVGERRDEVLSTNEGSFERWLVPLNPKEDDLVSVSMRSLSRRTGIIADHAVTREFWADMMMLSTGQAPGAETAARVKEAMVAHLTASGGDERAARNVFEPGGHTDTRRIWRGIVSDSVTFALAGVWCVSWLWLVGWRVRRRSALLARGLCPGCRYDVRWLDERRCPECGEWLTPE